MRESVLDKLKSLAPAGYKISSELPYDESGIARYIKNPKTFYVDRDNIESAPLFLTLDNSVNISQETTVVRVYFTTDAKNAPTNYETVINDVRGLKNTISNPGSIRRECFVSTSYEGDLLLSELEFRLTKTA